MSNEVNHARLLCACASKDPTRYHMNGLHFHGKSKMVVTTDGHRLFATKDLWEDSKAGMTFNRAAFEEDFSLISDSIGEKKFPDLEHQMTIGKYRYEARLRIPQWFSGFTRRQTKKPTAISLTMAYGEPLLLVGGSGNKESEIAFDPYMIAPLAGQEVLIKWTTENSPIRVSPWETNAEKPWFLIFMALANGTDNKCIFPVLTPEEAKAKSVIRDNEPVVYE